MIAHEESGFDWIWRNSKINGRETLRARHRGSIFLDSVLVRENRRQGTQKTLSSETLVVTNLEEIINRKPDVVVECAGQGAVAEYAEAILTAGIDLMVISTGAFTDDDLRERLISKAEESGAQILLPSGAIAGIDGMGSLLIGGLIKCVTRQQNLL